MRGTLAATGQPRGTPIQTNSSLIRLAIRIDQREPFGMHPLIRDSLPTDVPMITAIYAHAVLHGNASFELDPPDATEIARRRNRGAAVHAPHRAAAHYGSHALHPTRRLQRHADRGRQNFFGESVASRRASRLAPGFAAIPGVSTSPG